MIDNQSSPPETASTDALFRRMVIVFTALSLMGAYGWLAGFARQPGGDFSFHWRWNTLLWAFIGFGSNAYFWRKVWPVAGQAAATRKDIIKGSAVLFLPCLWWITFPLRFLSGQHFWDVVIGLAAAATVLSFGAGMVIRLIKAFERSDLEDLKALDSANVELTEKEPPSKP